MEHRIEVRPDVEVVACPVAGARQRFDGLSALALGGEAVGKDVCAVGECGVDVAPVDVDRRPGPVVGGIGVQLDLSTPRLAGGENRRERLVVHLDGQSALAGRRLGRGDNGSHGIAGELRRGREDPLHGRGVGEDAHRRQVGDIFSRQHCEHIRHGKCSLGADSRDPGARVWRAHDGCEGHVRECHVREVLRCARHFRPAVDTGNRATHDRLDRHGAGPSQGTLPGGPRSLQIQPLDSGFRPRIGVRGRLSAGMTGGQQSWRNRHVSAHATAARRIAANPLQRQMLPVRKRRTSASLGVGFSASSARTESTNPGVQ